MSFAGGRAPHYNLDLKKAEQITRTMPLIFKCTKVLEAIIMQLQLIKEVFKAQKITLFIVDSDLQKNIFINKNEKKQNYKKLIVGGSDLVYGLFANESDFCGPVFKDVTQAGNHMYNNKTVLIPLKDRKRTLMCLQMIYDEKLKVGKGKKGGAGSV